MLFAFGSSSGSFYISHGRDVYWKGLPDSLETYLNNKRPWLRSLSVGESGAWFYKEMPSNESGGSYCVSSASSIAYRRLKEIYDSDEVINWVAFGPDGAYVIDTPKYIYTSNTSMVRNYKEKGTRVPLRCASFGYDGSWVVVEDDGEVRSHGLSNSIAVALKASPVRRVALSQHSVGSYFIEHTDGTTNFSLPVSWHPDITRIERMSVQLDNPPTSSGSSTKQNVLFAFGPVKDLYCISKGAEASWRGVNESLASRLKKPGTVSSVSMGEGGAYFWKGAGESFVPHATEIAYPEVWKVWKADTPINWVAFGPHGYYICDTPEKLYSSRSSIILRTYKGGNQVPLRCASFGYGGSWVVVEDDGVIRSHGLTAKVRKAMLQQGIRNIQLSLIDDGHFYIEYMDGTSDWSLPASWHDAVRRTEGNLPKPTPVSSVTLKRLEETDHEFSSVCFQFATSWRHTNVSRPSVRLVYKVRYDPDLHKRYKSYLSRVGNEQQLFHGTSRKCRIGDPGEDAFICYDADCSLCQILRTSFSVRYALGTGMFGSGIYSSATSSKAATYSHNGVKSNHNAMVLGRVAVGKMYCTDVADTGRKAPPLGYNSVCGLPGSQLNYDETVVYDDDAIRPAYLIIYDTK
ncbi:hypothetical protein FRB94_001802 [Tulasnella sp. JGI-2019a]|nr:hypothetical protein FRB94_001802 [Tulasnella sp. JGI-2019a]